MPVVWEEPTRRPGPMGRERSPERIMCDEAKLELAKYPGRWARLFDMDTKEDARRRASVLAEKGFRFAVRPVDDHFSVYGLCKPFVPDAPEQTPQSEPAVPSSFQ
jgi:hypothetical protein